MCLSFILHMCVTFNRPSRLWPLLGALEEGVRDPRGLLEMFWRRVRKRRREEENVSEEGGGECFRGGRRRMFQRREEDEEEEGGRGCGGGVCRA